MKLEEIRDTLRELQFKIRDITDEIEDEIWLQGKAKRKKAMKTKATKLLIHINWRKDFGVWEWNHTSEYDPKTLKQLEKQRYARLSYGNLITITKEGEKYLEEIKKGGE
jgi:hypothetical protein